MDPIPDANKYGLGRGATIKFTFPQKRNKYLRNIALGRDLAPSDVMLPDNLCRSEHHTYQIADSDQKNSGDMTCTFHPAIFHGNICIEAGMHSVLSSWYG